MMLTKEECTYALNDLKNIIKDILGNESCVNECVETLQNLIGEHFDNPPLEFEEIKQGMWIWDNVSKEWMKVEITRETYTKFIECWTIGWHLLKKIEYKENRFYRKEVQK